METALVLAGGCACGAIRFTVHGAPLRVGLCHCLTCRKAHAAAFNPFAVFPRGQVEVSGPLQRWSSSATYERAFCPACGSRVMAEDLASTEIELSLGGLDQPGSLAPDYECWVSRREPWLAAQDVPQYPHDRTAG